MERTDDPATRPPPIQPEQEWANALSHGLASLGWAIGGVWLVFQAAGLSAGLAVAMAVYVLSALGTFVASTCSHAFLTEPRLTRFRALDQAMIYLMIVGTYTPIVASFGRPSLQTFVMIAMWLAAAVGFVSKAIYQHRVNNIATWPYLAIGWFPSLALVGTIPWDMVGYMFAGGVIYSLGVLVLTNDTAAKYLHVVWHLLVVTASVVHAVGIYRCIGL